MYTELFVSLEIRRPLEAVAETFFSYSPSYMYYVKTTGERFRSFEADHKKAYHGEKTFRTVVIYFAIKINMFLSNMRSLYTLLCVVSH
jgi:hypothetical protein